MPPLVTVIIPVYNDVRYLGQAVDSILMQTYQDVEIVFGIEHGSRDGSAEYVRALRDPRVRWEQNDERLGLPATLNKLIRAATGVYVARMDADDIAHRTRLEKQVAFLEQNPDIALCGTHSQLFGSENWEHRPACDPETIRMDLLFGCTFTHPTVMFRRKQFAEANLFYDDTMPATEDYEFWARAAQKVKMANIPEILLHYRKHAASGTMRRWKIGQRIYRSVMKVQLERLLGAVDEASLDLHLKEYTSGAEQHELIRLRDWLQNLVTANDSRQIYDPEVFRQAVAARLLAACWRFPGALGYAVLESSWLADAIKGQHRAGLRAEATQRAASLMSRYGGSEVRELR